MPARLVPDAADLGEIPIKRFYLPFRLEDTCEGCGGIATSDLDTDGSYLSYPPLGQPFRHWVYCETCKREKVVGLHITFSITTCEPPADTDPEDEDEDDRVTYVVLTANQPRGRFTLPKLKTTNWDKARDFYESIKLTAGMRKRIVAVASDGKKTIVRGTAHVEYEEEEAASDAADEPMLADTANAGDAYIERNGMAFARPCFVCGAGALQPCRGLTSGREVYALHAARGLDLTEEPSP
jgi:hypothetical protein